MTHVNVNNNNRRRHVNNLGGIPSPRFNELSNCFAYVCMYVYAGIYSLLVYGRRTL